MAQKLKPLMDVRHNPNLHASADERRPLIDSLSFGGEREPWLPIQIHGSDFLPTTTAGAIAGRFSPLTVRMGKVAWQRDSRPSGLAAGGWTGLQARPGPALPASVSS